MNTESVDAYLRDGCGRCEHYQTPACKVLRWTDGLVALRALAQAAGLAEEMKWGSPCYTHAGKNVVMIASFKDSFVLSFFKGAALADPERVLESAGPNARHMRLIRFRSLDEVRSHAAVASALIAQAIELEKSGRKVAPPPATEPVPEELARRLDADTALARAFAALTPGRRRSHILHISGAKQAETRERRVQRCVPDILAGYGFNER